MGTPDSSLPKFFALLGVAGSGTDPALRRVNRREFGPRGGGYAELVDTHVQPAIALGAAAIYLSGPHGFIKDDKGDALYQAESWIAARDMGLNLLVDNFAKAWETVKVPVLYYEGGVKNSKYIQASRNDRERMRRARECYRLCFEADMMLGLDGDGGAHPNTNDAQVIDSLAEWQPKPETPQFLEALNTTTFGNDRPLIVIDSSYRRWRAGTGNLSWRAPLPEQVVYRIVDNPADPSMCNSIEWWVKDGAARVGEIRADGHRPVINMDPFVTTNTPFKVLFRS